MELTPSISHGNHGIPLVSKDARNILEHVSQHLTLRGRESLQETSWRGVVCSFVFLFVLIVVVFVFAFVLAFACASVFVFAFVFVFVVVNQAGQGLGAPSSRPVSSLIYMNLLPLFSKMFGRCPCCSLLVAAVVVFIALQLAQVAEETRGRLRSVRVPQRGQWQHELPFCPTAVVG